MRRVKSINSVIPHSMRVELPYVSLAEVTTTSNGAAGWGHFQTWSLNSIFDPDVSGVGHQPLGHDQWANLYHDYYVNKVRVRSTYSMVDTSPTLRGALVCLHQSTSATGVCFTTGTDNQLSYERSRIVGVKAVVKLMPVPLLGEGETISTLSNTFFQNQQLREFDLQLKSAEIGFSPLATAFCHTSITFPQATGATSVRSRVQLFYDVTFFNRVALGGS